MTGGSDGDAADLAAALTPFAAACRLIDSQYDRLSEEHPAGSVRRPAPDDLPTAFSYATLQQAKEALEKWEAQVGLSSRRSS
jgi:hypothetical protein